MESRRRSSLLRSISCRSIDALLDGLHIPKAELVHAYLWRRLLSCTGTKVATAGSHLRSLRMIRNVADYEPNSQFIQSDAIAAVSQGREVIGLIESLSPAEFDAAREMIRTYERDVLREPTWRGRPR